MVPKIKTAIITNVPAPYRVPVWRRVSEAEDMKLDLIFCSAAHIDTELRAADYGFNSQFLTGRYFAFERRFFHFDLGVWPLLNELRPDVVITTGYIPTFLLGFAWARLHGVPHVAMTDGTVNSEKRLTWLHRLIRRVVLKQSSAFVGASEGSKALFRKYKAADNRIHLSYLCADNQRFQHLAPLERTDFIFCGRFIAHKHPLFALQVAHQAAVRLGRKTSIDFVGKGALEEQLRAHAEEIRDLVNCRFLGYANQDELPRRYANAKIFLFPTAWDPWGVVANEACASGLPVIVSPYAGVASELIIEDYNGFIRALDLELWVSAAVKLLTDEMLYRRFSQNSRERVARYSFENSARGLADAIRQAHRHGKNSG